MSASSSSRVSFVRVFLVLSHTFALAQISNRVNHTHTSPPAKAFGTLMWCYLDMGTVFSAICHMIQSPSATNKTMVDYQQATATHANHSYSEHWRTVNHGPKHWTNRPTRSPKSKIDTHLNSCRTWCLHI